MAGKAASETGKMSSDDSVPVVPTVGGPVQIGGLTLLSLATGGLTLVICIVLAVMLLTGGSESTLLYVTIAAIVLALPSIICGGMAIDKSHGSMVSSRDKAIMVAGPALVGLGIVVAIFAGGLQMAATEPARPKVEKPAMNPLVLAPRVEPLPATEAPPAPPAPPAGVEGAPKAAAGTEGAPAAGGDATKPAAGGDATAPAAGGDAAKPAAGGDATAPAAGGDAAKPAAGGDATAPAAGGDAAKPAAGGDATAPAAPAADAK